MLSLYSERLTSIAVAVRIAACGGGGDDNDLDLRIPHHRHRCSSRVSLKETISRQHQHNVVVCRRYAL
uniref:Secreted protein n=1 Tax=Ascaris lumbricoides TaxID=6252 RepID=A0A0M3IAS1_ASCLU